MKHRKFIWHIHGVTFQNSCEAAVYFGVSDTMIQRRVLGWYDKRRNKIYKPKTDCFREIAPEIHAPIERTAWYGMRNRCLNKNNKQYKNYGGRGISVCERWRNSFENFFADMGHPPLGRSLERENNDGNYTPKNCTWATRSEQNRNQRGRPGYQHKDPDAIVAEVTS